MMRSMRDLPTLRWRGWFEGEKRPHRNMSVGFSYVPCDGPRFDIFVTDDYMYGVPARPKRRQQTFFYSGKDFPRHRILKPDNTPVAMTGTIQPGDLVIGNKFVVLADRPPIVLLRCLSSDDVEVGISWGLPFTLQPPDLGHDDEGVPEWPPEDDDEAAAAAAALVRRIGDAARSDPEPVAGCGGETKGDAADLTTDPT